MNRKENESLRTGKLIQENVDSKKPLDEVVITAKRQDNQNHYAQGQAQVLEELKHRLQYTSKTNSNKLDGSVNNKSSRKNKNLVVDI